MTLRGALFDDILRRCRRDAEQAGMAFAPPPAPAATQPPPPNSAAAAPPSKPPFAATEKDTESAAASEEDAVEDVDEDACVPMDEDDAQDANPPNPINAFTIMQQHATLPTNHTRILRQSNKQNNADLVLHALNHTAPKPKEKEPKVKTAPKAKKSKLLFADTTCGRAQTFTKKLPRKEWDVIQFDLKYNKSHSSGSYANVLEPSEMKNYANQCDAAAVDPPYKMISGGHHFSNCSSRSTSFMEQQVRYGIDVQLDHLQILGLYSKLMQSAVLITKVGGRVLVKCQASQGFPLDGLVLDIARSVGRLRYVTKFMLETNFSPNSNAENFSTLIVFEKTTMSRKKKDNALVVDDVIGKRNLEDDAARRELKKLTDNRFQTQASDALAKASLSNNILLIMCRHLVAKGTEPEQVKRIAHTYLEKFADKTSVGYKHCQNVINSFDPDKVHDNYSAAVKAAAKKRREEQTKRSLGQMTGRLDVAQSITNKRRSASTDAKRRRK